MGVPVKYEKEIVDTILENLVEGKQFKEAGAEVGVSAATIRRWRIAHPDFDKLVKQALLEYAQNKLPQFQQALYRKATGHTIVETKTEYEVVTYQDEITGEIKEVEKVKKKVVTEKQVAPDTMALIFGMTNLAPDQWKKRSSQELTENKNVDVKIKHEEVSRLKLSTDMLEALDAVNVQIENTADDDDVTDADFEPEPTQEEFDEFTKRYNDL